MASIFFVTGLGKYMDEIMEVFNPILLYSDVAPKKFNEDDFPLRVSIRSLVGEKRRHHLPCEMHADSLDIVL